MSDLRKVRFVETHPNQFAPADLQKTLETTDAERQRELFTPEKPTQSTPVTNMVKGPTPAKKPKPSPSESNERHTTMHRKSTELKTTMIPHKIIDDEDL